MRLELNGGKTQYDGVYAVSKYSELSISKSKVSPIMNGFPIIIDITKGGVIDRSGSLVWWMTNLTSPTVFKQAAWWSIEEWCYNKYKIFWDKFDGFYPRFRQAKLYDYAKENPDFVKFLELIWLDLISSRYELQKEVCKLRHDTIETELLLNLQINPQDLEQMHQEQEILDNPPTNEVSQEDLDKLSQMFKESEV